MASGEGAKAPFLNDYKVQFFWKRFPQTLTGGLRFRLNAPYYVYFYQIVVFLWPVLIGGIFTAVTEINLLKDNVCCYVYGAVMALSLIFAHLFRLTLARNSSNETKEVYHNVLAEDDEIEFVSCCSKETFQFIFPAKASTLNIFIHGLLSGLLCALSFLYLLPSTIRDAYSSTGAVVVIIIFGWLTLCIANFSLTVQAPPETATFRSPDDLEFITSLTRPFYVSVIAVVGVVARHYSTLDDIAKALYIVITVLPLLWTIGLLSPFDALLSWLGEQFLVFALGGTYMASDFRLLIILVLSGVVLLFASLTTNYVLLVTYGAILGFLLSLDLFDLIEQCLNKMTKSKNKRQSSNNWTIIDIGKHMIMLAASGAVAGVSSHFSKDTTQNMTNIFGCIFIALFVIVKILGDIQYVYVFAGSVRNPFYTKNAASLPELKKFKHRMRYVGQVYNILLTYVSPLVMVAFLGFFLNTSHLKLSAFLSALGTVRALRWVWQNTWRSLTELTVICIISWCKPGSDWWHNLGTGLQLMVIGLVHDRLLDFLQKASFMLTMFITSWTEPKQRHKATVPTLITSVLLFPFVLSVLMVSVVLSSPLQPLFCFPIFFVGFPRSKRMCPSLSCKSSSSSDGTVFYEQLVPQVHHVLKDFIAKGSVTSVSDFILFRYQDRFIIIQILERGYKYCTIIARGLELQETSCHTVEAAMVDDIFEEVFCKERTSAFSMNHHILNALTPLDCVLVETYSDAHNILTGVIDQPENIVRQSSNFIKCLTWVLVNHQDKQKRNESSPERDSPQNPQQTEQSSGLLGESEVISLKANAEMVEKPLPPVSNVRLDHSNKWDRRWSDTDWSDDDADENDEKTQSVFVSSSDDPILSFGLPAQDIGRQTDRGETNIEMIGLPLKQDTAQRGSNLATFPQTKVLPLEGALANRSPQRLQQPFTWASLLYSCKRVLPQIHSKFPEEWFNYVLKTSDIGLQEENMQESEDYSQLHHFYRDIVMCCFAVVNMIGLNGTVLDAGAAHIHRVYQGHIPWSPELDLFEQDSELKELVVKAFRYAFKLTCDEAVLGQIDDEEELLENLNDYKENWFIGTEEEPGWNEAILQEKPNLFSIGYNNDKGTYTSHLLTKQQLGVYAGRLNSEAVRGQWASLAMELLYLTNDDEERYSIQAHPVLLRNLTIQAADPPLGYAVYCSGSVHVPYGLH